MSYKQFQRMYKLSIGFYDGTEFSELFSITENKLVADINFNGMSQGSAPQISTIDLYNIGYEYINTLQQPETYLILRAGYKYQDFKEVKPDDLPVIYLGSVDEVTSHLSGTDLITTITSVPEMYKLNSAKFNQKFVENTPVSLIFKRVAENIGLTLSIEDDIIKSINTKTKTTLTGPTVSIMDRLCRKYKLNWTVDKGVIRVYSNLIKPSVEIVHEIPLQLVKGVPEVSIDFKKTSKEGTDPAPDANVTTFLYPSLNLREIVSFEIIDYSAPKKDDGSYTTVKQEFIITGYTHRLDSEGQGPWDTLIYSKADQTRDTTE